MTSGRAFGGADRSILCRPQPTDKAAPRKRTRVAPASTPTTRGKARRGAADSATAGTLGAVTLRAGGTNPAADCAVAEAVSAPAASCSDPFPLGDQKVARSTPGA